MVAWFGVVFGYFGNKVGLALARCFEPSLGNRYFLIPAHQFWVHLA